MQSATLTLLLYGLLFGALMQTAMYILARLRKDAGHVDVGWTAGVGILALVYALTAEGWIFRRILVGALGALWSFRLAYYIIVDRILPENEDERYQSLRKYWGKKANLYFFFFFVSQALLIVLFAVPHRIAASNPVPRFTLFDLAGFLLWIIAVAGETIADRQLARFRKQPENRGKTCRKGIWKYSRHPNYFFEWIHWWGYVFFAAGYQYWWITLIGPTVMFLFLFRVTGIPYNEKQALASRGDDYRRYQESTSTFFPWFPGKEKS